jgi:hypothetical protein
MTGSPFSVALRGILYAPNCIGNCAGNARQLAIWLIVYWLIG